MGGDLREAPAGKSPTFLVAALKDPIGATLDRVQIGKGWVDAKVSVRGGFAAARRRWLAVQVEGRAPDVAHSGHKTRVAILEGQRLTRLEWTQSPVGSSS